MVLFFLGVSILDLIGLGLIGPYIALVLDTGTMDGMLGRFVEFFGLPKDPKHVLINFGIILIFIFLIKGFFGIGIHWVIIHFGQRQQMRIRSSLMQYFQSMPYSLYLRRNSSEYIYSIQVLTGQFSSAVITLLRIVSEGIVGIVIISMLAWTNIAALTLLLSFLIIMVLGYDSIFKKRSIFLGKKANESSTALVKGINEGIEGIKEIRVLGHEKFFLNKVKEGARQLAVYFVKHQLIQVGPRYLLEFLMVSFVVLLISGMMFFDQNLKTLLPTIGVFGVAALRLMPLANVFSGGLVQLRFSRDAVLKLYSDQEQLSHPSWESMTRDDASSSARPDEKIFDTFRSLELQNLNFRYTNTLGNTLQNISLEILAGESVGLIGSSGSGKTTLVDVFLGLLEPHEGSICYNGKPLQQNLSGWRSQVAYLPQEVFLIDSTLRENIILGTEEEDFDESLFKEALRQARIKEVVEQLPKGHDTFLGEHGIRLSGGQRQRVALARAFYHKRSVLVMDEATSALDHETEQEIVEEIKHLKGKITLIVIAHRMTTVGHCDRIYRLDKGNLIESGTPENMLKLKKIINA